MSTTDIHLIFLSVLHPEEITFAASAHCCPDSSFFIEADCILISFIG